MQQQKTYITQVLQQLNIKYNHDNTQDLQELQSILLYKLRYPSTQLANIHMHANRLGTLDLRSPQELKSLTFRRLESLDKMSRNFSQKQHNGKTNNPQIQCYCCSFIKQPKTLPMCTSFQSIKNLGISTRLLFISYEHNIALLLLMFFIYCLYAIISNVLSCNYNSANLVNVKDSPYYKAYLKLISDWIFQVSLHANISCLTSYTAYQIQCWLGVIIIIVYVIGLAILKYRKFKSNILLLKKAITIQNFTILIQNLPINITKQQLERQLKIYQNSLSQEEKKQIPQHRSQIKIIKINRAAPMYLQTSLFQHRQIKQVNKSYQNIKNKLVQLIKSRRKYEAFQISQPERNKLYDQFEKQKEKRVEIYKKIVTQKIQHVLNQKKQILTSPAFITFQSTFNKQFLLKAQTQFIQKIYGTPFIVEIPTAQSQDKNLTLTIKDAPKPEQVIWTNFGQKKSYLIKKKILIFLITLIFLAGACAGLYFLQQANFQYAVENNKTNPSSTLALSLVVALSIVVISYLISFILLFLTIYERNITFMHQQRSLSHKVFLSQIGNFIIVPLIFNFFFKAKFTGVLSLSQTVFFLSLQNAFIFPVLKILDPIYLINRINRKLSNRPTKKLSLSQLQLNQKSQYLAFGAVFSYAYIIRTVLFTCFYAPLQPIIVVFTIVGMVSMYWIEKYCLFNRCKRPVPGNRVVSITVNRYLMFGPILFGIGCLIWPYYIDQQIIALAPCIIQIVLSVLSCFVPFEIMIDKMFIKYSLSLQEERRPQKWQIDRKLQQLFYSQNNKKFAFTYERMNYMTAHLSLKKHLNQKYQSQKQKLNKLIKRNSINSTNIEIPKANIHNILNFADSLSPVNIQNVFSRKNNMVKISKKNKNKDSDLNIDQMYEKQYPSYREHGFNDNQILINQILGLISRKFNLKRSNSFDNINNERQFYQNDPMSSSTNMIRNNMVNYQTEDKNNVEENNKINQVESHIETL